MNRTLVFCVVLLMACLNLPQSDAQELPEVEATGRGTVSDFEGNSWPAVFDLLGTDGLTTIVRFMAASSEYHIIIGGYGEDEKGAWGNLLPCPNDDGNCTCILTLKGKDKQMSGMCAGVLQFEITEIKKKGST